MIVVGPTLDPSDLAALRLVIDAYQASYPPSVLQAPEVPVTWSVTPNTMPASASSSAPVTVKGEGFAAGNHVTFVTAVGSPPGNNAFSIVVVDANTITCETPSFGYTPPESPITVIVWNSNMMTAEIGRVDNGLTITAGAEVVGESADPTAATPRRRGNGKNKDTEGESEPE